MDEVFKSIKAFLYDRSSSPLFGAFLVSWSLWNYRIFAILLSGESLETRFANIEALFSPQTYEAFGYQYVLDGHFVNGFAVPILATAFYIYVYPVLAKPVYAHSLKKQKELREIKQEREAIRLLSVAESRELYKRMSQMQGEFETESENYRKQIDSLTHTIGELEKSSSATADSDVTEADNDLGIGDEALGVYDDLLREKIEKMQGGEFELSMLFDKQDWSHLSVDVRQALGRRFKRRVERGDFPGVSFRKKGARNQLIYTKLAKAMNRLSEKEEAVLIEFGGLEDDEGLSAKDIQSRVGGHIDEIRLHIDNLVDNNFLLKMGETVSNEKLYSLQSRGRKYLVANGLLTPAELPG